MIDRIIGHFNESAQLKLDVAELLAPAIAEAAEQVLQCIMRDGKVLACGNGGSAAAAQHFGTLMTSRYERDRPGLAAVALSTNTSAITAIANDFAYEQIFARQVLALGQPGDVLLTFSVSGNSPNVLAAAEAARDRNMRVVAITGLDGGLLAEQLSPQDVLICVPAESAARIQETHQLIIHCLCDAIDLALLGV